MGFTGFLFRQILVHPPALPASLDFSGQNVLIAGANSGIGRETARQCVRLNAKIVILAVRTLPKGEEAKANTLQSKPSSKTDIQIWELEMSSFESVSAFGKLADEFPRLDIAILNAAVSQFIWTTSTTSGYEASLQVNHLSTAMLSLLLLPVLKRTSEALKRPSRLTFTSTEMHVDIFQRAAGREHPFANE
jgi:retinol dehydrogenase 12